MTATATMNGKAAVLSNPHAKPLFARPEPMAIPDGMKSFDRFVLYAIRWYKGIRGGKGGWTKVPINARTGGNASSTDPATWCSFEQAYAALDRGVGDGLGFMLGEADCGLFFAGIDLDDCRNRETGELTKDASDIIAAIGSYSEISPTQTGVKIFLIGSLPDGARTKNTAGTVEVYTRDRFFCLTGQRIEGTPKRIEQRQGELLAVWQRYIGSEQRKASSGAAVNGHTTSAALAAMLRHRPHQNESDGSKRLHDICCRGVEHDLTDPAHVVTVRVREAISVSKRLVRRRDHLPDSRR